MTIRTRGPLRRTCPTSRGVLEVYAPGPDVHLTVMKGFMEPVHAEVIIEVIGGGFARCQRPQHSYHDWLNMTGYETICRQRLTAWVVANTSLFGEVHIALRERIVAMGVQVAKLVIDTPIETCSTEAALFEHMQRVLDAPRPHTPSHRAPPQRGPRTP